MLSSQVYLIADIGANHDGSLDRAKMLILLAARAGANAVKFQHFKAESIVSELGFRELKTAHQQRWPKSVYETYVDYSIPDHWTPMLYQVAKAAGIDFMSTPYNFEAVSLLRPYIKAFKIGSGDITWLPFLQHVASQGKPVILSTGASRMDEVITAVETILAINKDLIIMQCNTNYSGRPNDLKYINLRVLETYTKAWPLRLGLSDHTRTHSTVLGAVALGATVIEKHLTDDRRRQGPDHPFSILPAEWKEMTARVRELEEALGSSYKQVEDNEREPQIVQRRCLRLTKDLPQHSPVNVEDLEMLRPAPLRAYIEPSLVIGKHLTRSLPKGSELYPYDLVEVGYD